MHDWTKYIRVVRTGKVLNAVVDWQTKINIDKLIEPCQLQAVENVILNVKLRQRLYYYHFLQKYL